MEQPRFDRHDAGDGQAEVQRLPHLRSAGGWLCLAGCGRDLEAGGLHGADRDGDQGEPLTLRSGASESRRGSGR